MKTTKLFSLLLLCLLAFSTRAQEFRASVAGQVTDASGAVLPGATITARNVATNATYKSTSGEDGEYVLRSLDPGNYVFTVEKTGFRKLVREGIVLQVGTQAALESSIANRRTYRICHCPRRHCAIANRHGGARHRD